jgi:exodeoxyribonuclease VII small subunit
MEKDEKSLQKTTFESALEELEDIADKLESGELGLDESIIEFEKGIKLANYCRLKLEEAERKIEILQRGESGAIKSNRVAVKNDTGDIEDDEELQGSLI